MIATKLPPPLVTRRLPPRLVCLCVLLSVMSLACSSRMLLVVVQSSWQGLLKSGTDEIVHTRMRNAPGDEDEVMASRQQRVTILTVNGTIALNSMVYTRLGERFGSLNYSDILDTPTLDENEVQHEDEKEIAKKLKAPCLLVDHHTNKMTVERWRDRNAPQCYVMLTGDEKCRTKGAEFRHFDYRDGRGMIPTYSGIYVPLGMRIEAWEAFQEISVNRSSIPFVKSSQRPYVYNAMFSESTSKSRTTLKTILSKRRQMRQRNRTAFVQVASRWTKFISENGDHVLPQHYVSILLNSIFTLSPIGHNPECFRLYEAVEAGSIPVIALDESYNYYKQESRSACPDALRRMRESDAPFVWLPSWQQLPRHLNELISNPVALDLQQAQMMEWYQSFMRSRFQEIEKALLTPREGSNRNGVLTMDK